MPDRVLGLLPDASLGRALAVTGPGCGLTERLAERCLEVVAVDARRAAGDPSGGGWPAGTFDLVVLADVPHGVGRRDLDRLVPQVEGSLARWGVVLLCHRRDRGGRRQPDAGDALHAAVEARGPWERLAQLRDPDVAALLLGSPGRLPGSEPGAQARVRHP